MLSYVVTYRNRSTGETRTFRVRAVGKQDAIEASLPALAAEFPSVELADPWVLFAVNRSEP